MSERLKVGDIVRADPSTPLRSGAEAYARAVVVVAEPFSTGLSLVSPLGDMRWHHCLDLILTKVGEADQDLLDVVQRRLDKEEREAQGLPWPLPPAPRYKIVETDNFGGDYPDESFLKLPGLSKHEADMIAATINEACGGENKPRYWKVVREGYKLQPGFEP